MTTTDVIDDNAAATPSAGRGDMKLEVVVLPVTDVGRAKRFYESLGWRLDADFPVGDDFRVVQLTPPGSEASIIFGDGITSAEPGSVEALQLTVFEIDAARVDLAARGVEVSEIFHDAGGVFHHAGTEGRVSGPAPEHADYGSFASFSDPEGNGWLLQEIKGRLPGRVSGMATRCDGASELSKALQRAAMAHGEHEARTGEADPDWPDWYAIHMAREHAGEGLLT
jgi:catechol 2,3-dioxygenase-like lactoylglutathione lyase family enzyme